ncbi:hypothetical protein C8R44DRAFT_771133 [Mycena epipterygia]|nr:hypothetical protein C8R44DRAFT_771133 [Mycena epipterygia]
MSSPFAARLGTNYCPEDNEVAEIKALLLEPTLRLKRLDDEIAEMHKALEKLIAQRDTLGAYVEGHKALISPVRRLPLDIIQEIFTACIPTHRNCVMSASEAPVLLGRICSSWRTLSFSTPRLWATIHVVEPTRPYGITSPLFEKKWIERLETMQTWLGRSGQCPLSISLESGQTENAVTPPPLDTPSPPDLFLRALIPFAPRWEHISFTTTTVALETLFNITEAGVPLLKSVALALQDRPYHHHPDHGFKWGLWGMLRGSEISCFSVSLGSFSPAELPLRWSRLTSLSISSFRVYNGFPPDGLLQTISKCPALRSCKLAISNRNDLALEMQWTNRIVELAFLHTLELSCVGGSAGSTLTYFLSRLSLPALWDFVLRGMGEIVYGADPQNPQIADLNTESQASLSRFFTASTCLESLQMDDMFGKSSLAHIIRNLAPTVRRLSIEGTGGPSGVDDDFLAVLTPGPGRLPLFCPTLKEISINQSGSISETAVLRFVTARMAVGPGKNTLKRVKIRFNKEMEYDILPGLQPFIEAGLEVSLHHFTPFPIHSSPWQGLADAPLPDNAYPYY